jgi:tRNA(His) 5'-end guanylyltransferase
MSDVDQTLPEYALDLDPAAFTVVRLDGRGFTRRANAYHRPFDPRFHLGMRQATEVLIAETPAVLAHTASDEISLVFPPNGEWFGHRASKWLSVLAGVASSALTRSMTLMDGAVSVDAKAFRATSEAEVLAYLDERARSSYRNMVNGRVFFGLIAQGKSPAGAQRAGMNLSGAERAAFVPNDAPGWERVGALVGYQSVGRTGVDPRTGRQVPVTRRVLVWREPRDFAGVQRAAIEILS